MIRLLMTVCTRKTVHGGLIMSMTDSIGSLTVATKGQWMTGVSTDIATTFARPAGRVGDVLNVKGTLVSMGESPASRCRHVALMMSDAGKTLAFTRIDFTDPQGRLVAYGREC